MSTTGPKKPPLVAPKRTPKARPKPAPARKAKGARRRARPRSNNVMVRLDGG